LILLFATRASGKRLEAKRNGASLGTEFMARKDYPVILLNLPATVRQRRLILVVAVVLLAAFYPLRTLSLTSAAEK